MCEVVPPPMAMYAFYMLCNHAPARLSSILLHPGTLVDPTGRPGRNTGPDREIFNFEGSLLGSILELRGVPGRFGYVETYFLKVEYLV